MRNEIVIEQEMCRWKTNILSVSETCIWEEIDVETRKGVQEINVVYLINYSFLLKNKK